MKRLRSRTPDFLLRFALLGIALLSAPALRAADWFGKAYENHMEFGLVSRSFESGLGGGKLKRYVLLNAGPGGPIVNPRPIAIPATEVLASAHAALTQAGFTPAESSAAAEIAIVVHYANGEYPPPFEFMGIDPVAVPSYRWPTLLRQFEQRYFRRDYSDAEHLNYVLSRGEARPGDLINLMVIRAFDAGELRSKKRWVLRWETRVSIDSLNRPLENHFRAMLLAASDSLGGDNRRGTARSAPIRNGTVEIGDLMVLPSAKAAEPAESSPATSTSKN